MSRPQSWVFRRFSHLLYWITPVVILFVIFRNIDLDALRTRFLQANLTFLLPGIAFYPVSVLVGALRWRIIVHSLLKRRTSIGFMLRHYWIGLSLGIFMPASIGWDAYRVAAAGKEFGHYLRNGLVIVIEKVMALVSTALMVVVLFFWANRYVAEPSAVVDSILRVAWGVLATVVLGLGLFLIASRYRRWGILWKSGERFLSGLAKKLLRAIRLPTVEVNHEGSFHESLQTISQPRILLPIFLFSFGIQVSSAVGNQLFFQSIGYDLPFIVNLFLTPVFFFVFLLPISFGSLGVREGAYILLYGLFGVPAEVALVVSFFGLFAVLTNSAIGGVLIWIGGRNRPEGDGFPHGEGGHSAVPSPDSKR